MHAIKRHLAATSALAVVLAALTGSALAAPPSTPPGQEKKAEQAAPAPVPTAESSADATSSEKGKATAPGQEKKSSDATVSNGINSTNAGVKPSNSTKKHTSCKTGGSMPTPSCAATTEGSVSASATSDHSKRYGNGKTAAQIAVSRGAPTGTEIRGPGNSQPHKVCGKNGNWVDVHAVKSYVGICTTATAARPAPANTASVTPQTGVKATPGTTAAIVTAGTAGTTSVAGGVAGVEATASGAGQPEAGGVAGAFGVLGAVAGGSLPFTGLPLWAIVLAALAAIALGTLLWRRTAPPAGELA